MEACAQRSGGRPRAAGVGAMARRIVGTKQHGAGVADAGTGLHRLDRNEVAEADPDAGVGLAQARVLLRDVLSVGGINALHPGSPTASAPSLRSTPASARSIPAGAVGTVAVPDDGSVIEALRSGDETAFARLVDHYHASLGRVARLSGKADAVTQSGLGFTDDGVSRFASSAMRWSRIL